MSFERYRNRVLSSGNNIRENMLNNSVQFVESSFEDSPSYRVVRVNGVDMGVRLMRDREYSVMNEFMVYKVMFKPSSNIDRGDIIKFDNSKGLEETWMAVYRTDHDLYPYVHIRRCNNVLNFDTELGEISHPVVIDNKLQRYQEIEQRPLVNLPDDSLSVAISYNTESNGVKVRNKFIIKDMSWEVQVVDKITNVFDGSGIVNMIIRRVPIHAEDPVENEPDDPSEGEEEGGGGLW